MEKIIFIHGLESSGSGYKGRFFKNIFPDILTPDFMGDLDNRMELLNKILERYDKINVIGSSFGGLMATIYAINNSAKVNKMVLLAPALSFYKFNEDCIKKVVIPVYIFHGKKDNVVPFKDTQRIAEKIFENLDFHIVDDDHMLHKTIKEIPWKLIF
jgi:pimeloyl-ACP methyl ester carboxylesterase